MAIENYPIIIVGCGPGSSEYLTFAGRTAIDSADVLIGASRLLNEFPSIAAERIIVGKNIVQALDAMETHVGRKRMVVLVTGDPGLYSLARSVIRRFGRESCCVIPGISAVQMAFARIGLDWEDACICSLHGEKPAVDPASMAGRKKIAVLTSGNSSRAWLRSLGFATETTHEVFVCSNLTLADESVARIAPQALGMVSLPSRSIVLFINKECLW